MVDKKIIADFLAQLTAEKKYFDFSVDKLVNAEVIVPAFVDDTLVGLTGIYRMYGLPTFFIVVKEAYQGQGHAKQMMETLYSLIKGKYLFVILTVHAANARAIALYQKQGYRVLGKIGVVLYMVRPLTAVGHIVWGILKLFFPLIRIVRKNKHTHWETNQHE